jgi:plasmid stabilization system protein ParE
MRRFRLSQLAKSDLAEIWHFIRRDKPGAADKQIARFFDGFDMLARNSESGQERPELGPDLRIFSTGTYVIV